MKIIAYRRIVYDINTDCLHKMNEQKLTLEQKAKKLKTNQSFIRRLYEKAGVKHNSPRVPVLRKDEFRVLLKKHKTYANVGRDVGVSKERIRQLANKYGIFRKFKLKKEGE
jgi:hypothetical protein